MGRDRVYRDAAGRAGRFEFNAEVAEAFDDMVVRSVPFYLEQQNMITEIGKKFWVLGTGIYDLGCSTATTLINLCQEIEGQAGFVGYDNSPPMLERARRKRKERGLESRIEVRYGDLNEDLSKLSLQNASIVTLCWTLQFIDPLRRDNLVSWVHHGLIEGGVMVGREKFPTTDPQMTPLFVDFYHEFKRRNGYSGEEILRKREALENVLIPYRIEENVEMIRRNGWEIVETFFQWYNFVGFLCLKNAP